ncbi:LysR family transcriptional regulator [Oharaeibacter diazotrophicus]|uniref:LysR family glycine cleavage system transcriptional activator n=1 Tax=Oharaeibacter diazotrophicus TaxID=1920512 RepID=A0A4R6RKF2_9HYPH|nr:LysR family transcriptional regulator [Oharaeibacter diazotrophicus]TDP86944.1 LysR family glycine cleavage system transcriptional activator [Oharaeibacter diazotrophicus]BBE71113.1 glycine cleavage system transcriptional activator [Pleomorphomonas sp. SM30]GLS77866.1 transcriptional regulator [Oharaeibacter diazotrophicus]
MARPLLPSITALTAFESAARHLSFSRAAAELHLTQGAVSRQIRQLEETLGLDLFERVNQRVFLTDAGATYLADVRGLIDGLAAATRRVMASAGGGGVLELAVLPTFATRWLMPRLPAFLAAHPGATVNFSVRLEPFSFADDRLDAAIHHGEATWPGAVCVHLCDEQVIPVASPSFRDDHSIGRADDLARVPLLHQATRPTAWRDWFEAAGVDAGAVFRGSRFDQFAMIAGAAVAGLGAALVPRFLIEEELRTGRLAVLFDRPLSSGTAYWYVFPEEKSGSALVRVFGEWLARESAPVA